MHASMTGSGIGKAKDGLPYLRRVSGNLLQNYVLHYWICISAGLTNFSQEPYTKILFFRQLFAMEPYVEFQLPWYSFEWNHFPLCPARVISPLMKVVQDLVENTLNKVCSYLLILNLSMLIVSSPSITVLGMCYVSDCRIQVVRLTFDALMGQQAMSLLFACKIA
ncbi:hypothetical protein L7F22_057336 [Adiantum nelumboides]|nr:hypothetical protein [Adiantum nelumboides]